MFFNRPTTPPEPKTGFPSDAVVVVIPKVLIDRAFTLVFAVTLTVSVPFTLHLSLSNNVDRVVQKN